VVEWWWSGGVVVVGIGVWVGVPRTWLNVHMV